MSFICPIFAKAINTYVTMRLLSFVLSTVALLFTGCDNELENNRLDPVRGGVISSISKY